MPEIALLCSTGFVQIDQIIRGIVGLVEHEFPGRVRGYYLEGSYADGSAVDSSDIDLCAVFRGDLSEQEQQRFEQIIASCKLISPCALDIHAYGETTLLNSAAELAHAADYGLKHTILLLTTISIKLASRLVYGEDIRAALSLTPIDTYARYMVHFPCRIFKAMRRDLNVLTFPLDYPDPTAEFYGYTRRRLRLRDGTTHASTKQLLLVSAWIATGLIALIAGRYVANKRDCIKQYRAWIDDEWAAFLETTSERCRTQWRYLVPEREPDCGDLRALCERALAFENHFLTRYRTYLLGELKHPDQQVQLFAARRLGQIVYGDPAVTAALQAAGARGSAELRQAAAETLRLYS